MKLISLSLISRLTIVGFAGLIISACSNTMEGVGKDLQKMGPSMGGSSTQQSNQSQTKGKDVVVTPVK